MGRKVVSGHGQKMGRCFIDAIEVANTSWNVSEIAEEEETTNSTSQGYNEYEYGNKHLEGSIEMDWDISLNPFVGPPVLASGGEYAFNGYIHAAAGDGNEDGPQFQIDKMRINNLRVTIPAKGKVTFSFDFKSKGPYNIPFQASDSASGD